MPYILYLATDVAELELVYRDRLASVLQASVALEEIPDLALLSLAGPDGVTLVDWRRDVVTPKVWLVGPELAELEALRHAHLLREQHAEALSMRWATGSTPREAEQSPEEALIRTFTRMDAHDRIRHVYKTARPSGRALTRIQRIRDYASELSHVINASMPDCADKSRALGQIEAAVATAVIGLWQAQDKLVPREGEGA